MNNEGLNSVDLFGYISSKFINSDDLKPRLQNFFSSRSIRVTPDVINDLKLLIEEVVDDVNHTTIKDFLDYLKEKYNFSFIREQTNEVVLFDEDSKELDNIE